ncbi:MAG: membrane protein insertion efficiency factor YidD [Eubacterium sp.]|nr:membrane protein insertion efficiency factor YidD [Eubacterium sp.]
MKRFFLGIMHVYQRFISPMKRPCCRYYPSCSCYAVEAIEKHGACKGGYLAIRRVFCCHPFHEGGYDPVPETFSFRKNSPAGKRIHYKNSI